MGTKAKIKGCSGQSVEEDLINRSNQQYRNVSRKTTNSWGKETRVYFIQQKRMPRIECGEKCSQVNVETTVETTNSWKTKDEVEE